MHILFFTDTPSRGGAETHMLHLGKHLVLEGHQVSMIFPAQSRVQEMAESFQEAGLEWLPCPARGKHDPRLFWETLRILKKYPKAIPHFHLWNSASNRWGLLACKVLRRPFCITEHYPLSLDGIKKQIRSFLVPLSTPCISVSFANQAFLKKEFGISSTRIANGIEVKNLQEPKTGPVEKLLFLGEIHERKGLRSLIQSMKSLEIELNIYGKGPFQEEFEALAQENPRIHFRGFAENPEKIWNQGDCFILPSLEEPFGLVLLESTRAGLLCLASAVGGIVDIIEDGRTGFLFEAGNTKAIEEKIRYIQNLGSEEKRKIILTAQKKLEKEFDIQLMTRKTIQFYEDNF